MDPIRTSTHPIARPDLTAPPRKRARSIADDDVHAHGARPAPALRDRTRSPSPPPTPSCAALRSLGQALLEGAPAATPLRRDGADAGAHLFERMVAARVAGNDAATMLVAGEHKDAVRFQYVAQRSGEHLVLFPGKDLEAARLGTLSDDDTAALELGTTIMIELAARMAETIGLDVHPRAGAAVLARAMVLLDGLGLDSAALERSQRTTTVVAAGLAALEATGARDPAVLRRAFEACFEGRPDVSIVQSALLRSLHLDNAVPTFFQKVKDVIFPPGQPIVAVAPAILTRSQRTAQLMAALPHPPRVLDVGIKQILLLQGGLSSTIVGRGPVRPERDPPLAKANYARAIDFVIARAKDPRRPSLRDLVEINRLILANVVFPGRVAGGLAGRMRPGEIYAGNPRAGTVRHYAEQREIVPLLTMFRTWLEANLTEMRNGNVPPEAIACEAYRRLVAIHPFADGNGRTTRLMANLILLSAGRPPAALSTGEICPPDVHASAPSVYRGDSYMDAYAAAVQRSAMLLGRPKQHRLASRVVAQAAPAA